MYGAMVARTMIVLVVFPVGVHAIYTVVSMLLGFVLPSLLAMANNWSELLGKGLVGATFLLAVGGSFRVCRRLWPTALMR